MTSVDPQGGVPSTLLWKKVVEYVVQGPFQNTRADIAPSMNIRSN